MKCFLKLLVLVALAKVLGAVIVALVKPMLLPLGIFLTLVLLAKLA